MKIQTENTNYPWLDTSFCLQQAHGLVLHLKQKKIMCVSKVNRHVLVVKWQLHLCLMQTVETSIMQTSETKVRANKPYNNSDIILFLRADSISERGSGFVSKLSSKLCWEIFFFSSNKFSSFANSSSFPVFFLLLPANRIWPFRKKSVFL